MRTLIYILIILSFLVSPIFAQSLITGLYAEGHDCRIDLVWQPVSDPGLDGYYIYRSRYENGNYIKINTDEHTVSVYSNFIGDNVRPYWYYVRPKINGVEGEASAKVTATPYTMTDDELLTSIQKATFRYFWDFAHPDCGMARERFATYDRHKVTTGGTGMGLMTIVVGAERGFVTRAQAAQRVLQIITFLQDTAPRYHGAWPHWMNGTTGAIIPADYVNGVPVIASDIIETADMIQGMLVCRQYFDSDDSVETEIRSRATQLYEDVDWEWYRRANETDGKRLWWSWSPDPNFGWNESFSFGGGETMNVYLLAIASPTHPIPASCYYDGFGFEGGYKNGNRYYGYTQWVSYFETPMFWTHYSFLGFDPRNKWDNYCNYFENSRNIALIDRAYCMAKGYPGYGPDTWGLTSSNNPWGYGAHSPGKAAWAEDNNTVAPTAAISSMPYTPTESISAMKNFYYNYGHFLWGPLGFYDAFNFDVPFDPDWSDYLAIDQGTIVPMIENYRTGLCWNLFMSNPEIKPMLESIGWATRADNGLNYEYYEGVWNALPDFDSLTPVAQGKANNFDIGLRQRDDYFAFRFKGYIDVPRASIYTFYISSDNGSQLFIDDVMVVNNDGLHDLLKKSGNRNLTKGRHSITVTYFDNDSDQDLIVSYSGGGITEKQIQVNNLFRCPENLPGDFSGDCLVNIDDLKIIADNWLNGYTFIDFAEMAEHF
ncbi:MAG: hypothetical protein A2Y10_05520 [Planctomycetes bacterium GWF2_41_51]|nr:MAG: hypothetical protein A2Y10_05520 [Planctomycetes bacterium GWF2_41_51]HBG26782.1 hypothetical protein [Phycisphaerales bacterium]